MMKATIETSLIESRDVTAQDSTVVTFDNLASRVKRILQFTFPWEKRTGKTIVDKGLETKSERSLFVALLRHQCQKTHIVDQSVKDEFFFRRDARRKSIPQRTWNRHSAFLFYGRQMQKQKLHGVPNPEQLVDPVVEKRVEPERRMSFQVKSIKPLPVWASAYHEMSWIESDLSSLRLMEMPKIQKATAEAA